MMNYCSHYPERREFRRIRVRIPTFFKLIDSIGQIHGLKGEEFMGRIEDISEIGTTLITSQYVPNYSEITIKLILLESTENGADHVADAIEIQGRVIHIAPVEERNYRIGIYFGPTDEEKQSKFFDVICSPQSRPEENPTLT